MERAIVLQLEGPNGKDVTRRGKRGNEEFVGGRGDLRGKGNKIGNY